LADINEAAVRYHIRLGHIRPLPDGTMNPGDATTLRKMQRIGTPTDQRGANLVRVKVLGGVVKTRRLRLAMEELQDRTIERKPVEAALIARMQRVMGRLATWPERYVEEAAAELGIDVSAAEQILRRFTAAAVDELGDLEEEATVALRRL
jgi:hypothetical protein